MANPVRPTVLLVDPTGADAGLRPLALAHRPIDLRGKRLGLLDNSKENSEFILRAIAGILDEEFRFSEVFCVRKTLVGDASQAGGVSRTPEARRRGDNGCRGLRGLLVGQSARRSYAGGAGASHGHHHNRRVREGGAGIYSASGYSRVSLPGVPSPHHRHQPIGLGSQGPGACTPGAPSPHRREALTRDLAPRANTSADLLSGYPWERPSTRLDASTASLSSPRCRPCEACKG